MNAGLMLASSPATAWTAQIRLYSARVTPSLAPAGFPVTHHLPDPTMLRISVLLGFLTVFLASGLSAQEMPVPGLPWNTPASVLLENLQREGYVLSIYNGSLYVLHGRQDAEVRVVYLDGRFQRYAGAWRGPDVVQRGVPMVRAALAAYGTPTLVIRMGDTIPPDSAAQWESWPADLPVGFFWRRDGAMLEILLIRTPSGPEKLPILTVTAEARGYSADRQIAVAMAHLERRIRARDESGTLPQDTTHWRVLSEGRRIRESLFHPVVTRTGPGQVRAWVEIDGATFGESGPTIATLLTEHNCRSRTSRSLGIVIRVKGGDEEKALFDPEIPWGPVPAGWGSRAHAALCAHPSARSE